MQTVTEHVKMLPTVKDDTDHLRFLNERRRLIFLQFYLLQDNSMIQRDFISLTGLPLFFTDGVFVIGVSKFMLNFFISLTDLNF